MKLFASALLLCTVACSARQAAIVSTGSDTAAGTVTKNATANAASSQAVGTSSTYPSGLPRGIFGSSYALNQPIDTLPVDTRSIATGYGPNLSAASTGTVNNEVGKVSPEGSSIYGLVVDPEISPTVIASAQHPEQFVNVTYTADGYISESDSIDPGYTGPNGQKRTRPIPIRDAAIAPGTDRQIILVDTSTNRDYELYHVARAANGSLTAQQVTVWDMLTGKRISDNGCDRKPCTSADAAGLPILAGLLRYEEVQYAIDHNLPDIGHAIRVTYVWTRRGAGATAGWFVAPATHAAGNGGGPVVMGMRLRIPAAAVKPATLSPADTVIWNTLKKYGEVVADNGATGFLTGDLDSRWKGPHNFSIPASMMSAGLEVVNTGCWSNAEGLKDNTGILGAGCQKGR